MLLQHLRKEDIHRVKRVIELGCDPNFSIGCSEGRFSKKKKMFRKTPLYLCVRRVHDLFSYMEMLFPYGPPDPSDPNVDQQSRIRYDKYVGHESKVDSLYEVTELLLQNGANPDMNINCDEEEFISVRMIAKVIDEVMTELFDKYTTGATTKVAKPRK